MKCVVFEVLKAVVMNVAIFWDTAPCSPYMKRYSIPGDDNIYEVWFVSCFRAFSTPRSRISEWQDNWWIEEFSWPSRSIRFEVDDQNLVEPELGKRVSLPRFELTGPLERYHSTNLLSYLLQESGIRWTGMWVAVTNLYVRHEVNNLAG
jgi:hypothetical protein